MESGLITPLALIGTGAAKGVTSQSVHFALMDRVGRLVVTAVGQHTQIAEIVSSPLLVSAEGFLISA